jgi:uncharacterized protein YndB with AHSA1/START domain
MSSGTITLARSVPAPPDQVFTAWTAADRLATWWWPQLAGTTYAVDARTGGSYRIESPVLGVVLHGRYTEVDPPRRLAFTWVWESDVVDGQAEQVEVELAELDGGTRVDVVHRCRTEAAEGDLEQGRNDVLDRLVRVMGQSTSSRS